MNLDLDEVIENVTEDFTNSADSIDYSYQSEGWYKATLTACRAVNLLLCFILVTVFATGGI